MRSWSKSLLLERDFPNGQVPPERLEKVVRGELPPPPVAKLIGFRLTSIQPGEAIVEFAINRIPWC